MANIAKIIYLKWRFRFKHWLSPKTQPEFEHLRGKKKCLVMLAADYGNLGDVAITFAQEKFLCEHFPDYEIVDLPISRTLSHLKAIKNISTTDDIVTIVGGGNMSDLYFDIELLRQMVVKAFPANRVILFPQTMFFSDSLAGLYLKKRANRVYSKHKQLTISAREKWSFMTMKDMMSKSILVPDIVMSLDKREPTMDRKGITLCLRHDQESKLSDEFNRELREKLSKDYNLMTYDTHIGRNGLSPDEREAELNKIWSQFRSSEWVITDRLHGMIFAFITGSPCIVLPNNNYKIEGCYSWIKGCGYIHFYDDANVNQLLSLLQSRIQNVDFEQVHNTLKAKTKEILNA